MITEVRVEHERERMDKSDIRDRETVQLQYQQAKRS